jgi:hypothetical protein
VYSGCGPVFQDQSVHTLPVYCLPVDFESVDTIIMVISILSDLVIDNLIE